MKRLLLSLVCLIYLPAFSQGVQLTPAQQQLLNSLPPEQRQQATDAIRQLSEQESTPNQQSINEPLSGPETQDVLNTLDTDISDDEARAEGRSRLVLEFSPKESLLPIELRELEEDAVLQQLMGSRLYVLDESGILSLPGLEPIPLLGMNIADIRHRVQAEPYLSVFYVDVRILEQTRIGVEALNPFGYDLFDDRNSRFDSPSTGPVPPDYVLGPGDTVRVQLFGNSNGIYEYEVSRDGVLNLPEIGPVTVAGLPFSEFREDLKKRVDEMLIGTQVSVTMGQLRRIRVFLLGDVNEPGSYVVSGLATVSGALYQGGGISSVGSLRDVQLKRNGRVVARVDMYDLLLEGDTSAERRLQPGDVIFVPPIGATVGVGGAVKRPAIYETKGTATIADVVELAGGLMPDAYAGGVRIERVDGERQTIAIDLENAGSSLQTIRAGDTIVVPEILPNLENTVVLSGHVFRPGNYQWYSGMRLTDLIRSPDELRTSVDLGYVLIRRERTRGQPIEILSANLGAALRTRSSDENIRLEASDTVYVFSLALGRQRIVEPLLEELKLHSTIDAPIRKVEISGNVRAPGVYPLETNMRISDLIRAGGNLNEAAYGLEAELTRYSVGAEGREIEVINVDLDAVRRRVESADVFLQEHDFLIINRLPVWDSMWTVSIEGEVLFPGDYRVQRGETLSAVIERAGGFTDSAFVEGAVFLRDTLREQEQEQIENLARRLEADLATLSLQSATSGDSNAQSTGRVLLDQLRRSEAVGRLVIDLRGYGENVGGNAETIEMRDGDKLLVPTRTQVVSVIGETQQNTSHLYQPDLKRDDYINLSGGLTRRADKKLIYVVRSNGAVVADDRSRWIGRRSNYEIRPGDTIVVPLDTDRMRPLAFWGSVTQLLYQGAIAVAAVKTFNN